MKRTETVLAHFGQNCCHVGKQNFIVVVKTREYICPGIFLNPAQGLSHCSVNLALRFAENSQYQEKKTLQKQPLQAFQGTNQNTRIPQEEVKLLIKLHEAN